MPSIVSRPSPTPLRVSPGFSPGSLTSEEVAGPGTAPRDRQDILSPVSCPHYLVRHGQSEWNLLELTQGQTAWPRLTSEGRSQAARAADRIRRDLGNRTVEVIRSSDLVRARETAEILQRRLGGRLELDPRLREQDLGELEGKPYSFTWAAADRHDWSDPSLPVAGGESALQVRARVAASLADTGHDSVTVFVTHGDTIRAALATARSGSRVLRTEPPPWVDVPNGAVARWHGAGVDWISP